MYLTLWCHIMKFCLVLYLILFPLEATMELLWSFILLWIEMPLSCHKYLEKNLLLHSWDYSTSRLDRTEIVWLMVHFLPQIKSDFPSHCIDLKCAELFCFLRKAITTALRICINTQNVRTNLSRSKIYPLLGLTLRLTHSQYKQCWINHFKYKILKSIGLQFISSL